MSKLNEHTIADLLDFEMDEDEMSIPSGSEFSDQEEDEENFFRLNIAMTYLRYPQLRMYWSSVEGIKIPFIADNMTNNRFEEIKRNLHFASDEERIKGDGYWRVHPVLDILHQTFHEANDNSEHQAIDEMMIPFKGRNSLKQSQK
ncbi:piggyBac transposable element-derived protein 3-like [Myzus persicae]|uniref:piggyBac transposable element-derived protein 3-like n=1 Tax=Myzus persicae TaxID=13164 RepID=UPI000B93522E|nr:piggyBac transposable element-derived protein 3-like [Myzus persicae]